VVRRVVEPADRGLDPLHDARRGPRVIGGDVAINLGDVGERVVEPADLHNNGS
jgi:hypothetical protein